MTENSFKFPSIYNFPPFFTKQPNINTYETQVEHWRTLISRYCQFYKIWALSLSGKPLLENNSLDDEELDEDTVDSDEDDSENVELDINTNNNNNNNIINNDTKKLEELSIFKNDEINRTVQTNFILEIYEDMIKHGQAGWIDPKNHKMGLLIYWHSLEDWSHIIYDWIDNTGQQGSILTLYELRKGELTVHQEFHKMNKQLMVRIINILVKKNQASILKDDDGNIAGVKFGGL